MAMQLGALRDALIDAGASDDNAREAAEEAAGYDSRLAAIDTRFALLAWMAGANVGLTLLPLGSLLAIWPKLGALAGQLAQIARIAH